MTLVSAAVGGAGVGGIGHGGTTNTEDSRFTLLAAERARTLAVAGAGGNPAGKSPLPSKYSEASGASQRKRSQGEERAAILQRWQRELKEATGIRNEYSQTMTRRHTVTEQGMAPLRRALDLLLRCERAIASRYEDGSGKLHLEADALKIYFEVVDNIASTYDDLDDIEAVRYYERLIAHDKCRLLRTTNATLEYEYCSGRLFSRAIMLYRHRLKRSDLAKQLYLKAVSIRFNGERVHWWPNEWHISTIYMKGLRSHPFWEGARTPPLAMALEENFATIRAEFLAALARPEYQQAFTQNDHAVISSGSWGELKLYGSKSGWKEPCGDVTPRTCALLSHRPELVGTLPTSKTHNVDLPKEAAFFKLMPGTMLKPHTGPVNFQLYCHLGVIIPEGPRIRIGNSKPRKWSEGNAFCFDDSFDHEAWHDGTEPRYILYVTLLHPDLGEPVPNRSAVTSLPPLARGYAEAEKQQSSSTAAPAEPHPDMQHSAPPFFEKSGRRKRRRRRKVHSEL